MQPLPAQKQARVLSLGKNEEDSAPARRAAERLIRRYHSHTPQALNPTPYTLHVAPYILYPTPCTLPPDPYPYTLHPTPYTLHPTS